LTGQPAPSFILDRVIGGELVRGSVMIQYVIDRLKERTTRVGLMGLVTAADLVIQSEWPEAVIAADTGLAGLTGVATRG
jgi:aspartate aminotransferase-like enzyme